MHALIWSKHTTVYTPHTTNYCLSLCCFLDFSAMNVGDTIVGEREDIMIEAHDWLKAVTELCVIYICDDTI